MDVITGSILPVLLLGVNIICIFFSIFYAFKEPKDLKHTYNLLDKIALVTNMLIIILTTPYLLAEMFITLLMLLEIYAFTFFEAVIVISTHLSMSVVSLCLAQSTIFRHNGMSMKSFLTQFVGVLWLVITTLFFRELV